MAASETPSNREPPTWLALFPMAFFLVHPVAQHVLGGNPWDALWACYLANLVLAIGLMKRSAHLVGIAAMWLMLGNMMWFIHLVTGGEFVATGVLPHIAGFVVAVIGVLKLGFRDGTWYRALVALSACVLLSHWLTPPSFNVNLSHAVWAGWESIFPSYPWYMTLIGATTAALFFSGEKILLRLLPKIER